LYLQLFLSCQKMGIRSTLYKHKRIFVLHPITFFLLSWTSTHTQVPAGKAVPAPLVTSVVLLSMTQTTCDMQIALDTSIRKLTQISWIKHGLHTINQERIVFYFFFQYLIFIYRLLNSITYGRSLVLSWCNPREKW
jgi:hypothetical protein